MKELVLASASASRQRMLRAAGVRFRVLPADLDEQSLIADLKSKDVAAAGIAGALAAEKALSVSRRAPGALVLGGDSVLALGMEIVSKSRNLGELKTLLKNLSGKTHQLISAAVLARDGREIWRHAGIAHLTMRPLSEAFIDSYLAATGESVLSSVGGYHYEGPGAQLFRDVEGDAFTIMGLPLLAVLAALRDQGFLPA
jgi:septum formation protein